MPVIYAGEHDNADLDEPCGIPDSSDRSDSIESSSESSFRESVLPEYYWSRPGATDRTAL